MWYTVEDRKRGCIAWSLSVTTGYSHIQDRIAFNIHQAHQSWVYLGTSWETNGPPELPQLAYQSQLHRSCLVSAGHLFIWSHCRPIWTHQAKPSILSVHRMTWIGGTVISAHGNQKLYSKYSINYALHVNVKLSKRKLFGSVFKTKTYLHVRLLPQNEVHPLPKHTLIKRQTLNSTGACGACAIKYIARMHFSGRLWTVAPAYLAFMTTTSLHSWPITLGIKVRLCLFKHHNPRHTLDW